MSTARHVRAEGLVARATGVRALLGVALALAVVGGVAVVTHDGEPTDTESAATPDEERESTTDPSTGSTGDDADGDALEPGAASPPPTPAVGERPSARLRPIITGTRRTAPVDRDPERDPETAPGCRNAVAGEVDDPAACGPFRWDPAPTNRPAELEVLVSHGEATVGQPVTFNTRWSDPDAPSGHIRISGFPGGCGDACPVPAPDPPDCDADRIGPWTPPRAVAGEDELAHTVHDLPPGTYDWTVSLTTSSTGCDDDPYTSTAIVTGRLVVVPAFGPLPAEPG